MRKSLVVCLAGVVALTGCTLGPNYKRPGVDMPGAGSVSKKQAKKQRKALASWWTRFDDPTLNHLIKETLHRNLKIAKQVQVIRQERAALGLANSHLYPSISAQAKAARQELSGNAGISRNGGKHLRYNQFSISGSLSYTLDLFGRLRRARQAARAQLLKSAYNKDAIRLTEISDVVTNYVTLRSEQRQIKVTRHTIKTRKQALKLDKERYKYGDINKLTLLQTRSSLQSAKAQLPTLQKQMRQTRTALAILVGKTPRQIMNRENIGQGNFHDIHIPKLPKVIPSLIINRRPDIRVAEAKLIAANANVGEAKAKFFPSISLTAMIGPQATHLNRLFDPLSMASSITGSLTQPLLDFGQRSANLNSKKAQKQEAIINYRQTLRQAFQSVKKALIAVRYTRKRLKSVRSELADYRQTLKLARTRYKAGQTNFFNVLDAQRNVYSTQLTLAQAISNRFIAIADLYKALGGGWTHKTDSLTPSMEKTMQHYDSQSHSASVVKQKSVRMHAAAQKK